MIDKKALGAAIRNQRKSKKLRQNDVSVETNLSRNYISDIESGRYAPSIDALSKLALCLDLDLNILKMSEIQVNGGDDSGTICSSRSGRTRSYASL